MSEKIDRTRWLLLFAAAVLFLIGILVFRHFFRQSGYPSWVRFRKREESICLNTENVRYRLSKGHFRICSEEGSIIWESDPDWKVSDCIIGDIDGDPEEEILLLVWKRGSYGDFKPFWVEEDEETLSEHIFIYDWNQAKETRMQPIWMSSKMGIEAADWRLDEDRILHLILPDGTETGWFWYSWGLVLLPE